MKVLIIGRTAAGKDALRECLETRHGWKFVKSCTTRPRRTPDEDTHVFVTSEEACRVPESEKAAWTLINGYEYYATKEQVHSSDAYIIDPDGAELLLRNMPEERFLIIHLSAGDEATRERIAVSRASDPEAEREVFRSRCMSEDAQFKRFENGCGQYPEYFRNCAEVMELVNGYRDGEIASLAMKAERERTILLRKEEKMREGLSVTGYVLSTCCDEYEGICSYPFRTLRDARGAMAANWAANEPEEGLLPDYEDMSWESGNDSVLYMNGEDVLTQHIEEVVFRDLRGGEVVTALAGVILEAVCQGDAAEAAEIIARAAELKRADAELIVKEAAEWQK